MAEGGGDLPTDDVDEGIPQFQRQLSHQEVGDQAVVLLQHFITDRFDRDSVPNAPRQDVFGPAPPSLEKGWHQTGLIIREMGDNFDKDMKLRRQINSVPTGSPIKAIIAVAESIFGDGEINWGRIIGLFYFAYRICVRAMDKILPEKFSDWLKQLIKEIVKFLVRRFADWIIRRGGWMVISEYFSSPTQVWVILVFVSFATLAFSVYKLNK